MPDTNNPLDQFDDLIKKQKDDLDKATTGENPPPTNGDSPSPSGGDNTPPAPGDNTPPSPQPSGENTPPTGGDSPAEEFDGESHAYDNLELRDRKQKGQKESGGGGSTIGHKAPDHGKFELTKKKDDNIMEIFWGWWVEWTIERPTRWVVNTTLDFADFVFYGAQESGGIKRENKEDKKKSVFDYGEDIKQKYVKNINKLKSVHDKAHAEILDNVERSKAGEELQWKEWRGQPEFFDSILEMERTATSNPSSPEAQKWENFKKCPEFMQDLLNKEVLFRSLSVALATIDESLVDEKFELPKDVTKKIKEIEDILKDDKKKKMEPAELKTKIKEKVDEMKPLVAGDGYVNETIRKRLTEMERFASGSETDVKILREAFSSKTKQIKDVNPVTQRIESRGREYYENMMQNVDKIKEKYHGNEERSSAVARDYAVHMIEAIEAAITDSEKYENAFILRRKKTRKASKNSAEKASAAINNFMLEGAEIGSATDATRRSSNPFATAGRAEMLGIIRGRAGR